MFFMKTINIHHKKNWNLPAGTKLQTGLPTLTFIFVNFETLSKNTLSSA